MSSPAAERNADPIADVLQRSLPDSGRVLEIASGGGYHAVRFAARFSQLVWQPTDRSPEALRSIEARRVEAKLDNLLPPLELDVEQPWPAEATADAMVCINMLHVAPWSAGEALFAGARERLPSNGPLLVYGPFNVGGGYTSEGNRAFDADLRGCDPRLGLRDVEEVERAAAAHELSIAGRVPMPANNLSLLFRRNERR